MDLHDYLRMLRRGWPAVVLVTAMFLGLSAVYLAVSPKQYESTAALLVSAGNTESVSDLQQGTQFSSAAVITYARIIASETVLGPVANEARPQRDPDDLGSMVTATVPEDTRLIEITVVGDDAAQATALANSIASTAVRIVPGLDNPADAAPIVRLQQVRQATEPVDPVSPSTDRVLALGVIIGLCVGLGVTIAAQTLDTRLRQVDDVHALTDVPLLAVLPRLRRAQRHGVVVRDDPAGAVGEAYRTLRTNLRFLEAKDRRSMVFTAVSDDRDGAQVPANLAWSLAQAEWRVLLVDLDLRQSTVGDAFALRGVPGLADVLMGQAQLGDVVQSTGHAHLKVIASGTQQASPADLLSAPAMTNVLRDMERSYDYVILHSPPLLSFTDTALVSDVAGGTFLTIAAGRTRAHELTTAIGVLANVRVKPLGTVLTGARNLTRPGGARARLMAGMVRRRTPLPSTDPAPAKSPAPIRTTAPQATRPPASPAQVPNLDPPTLRHHPAQSAGRFAAPARTPSGDRRSTPAEQQPAAGEQQPARGPQRPSPSPPRPTPADSGHPG